MYINNTDDGRAGAHAVTVSPCEDPVGPTALAQLHCVPFQSKNARNKHQQAALDLSMARMYTELYVELEGNTVRLKHWVRTVLSVNLWRTNTTNHITYQPQDHEAASVW